MLGIPGDVYKQTIENTKRAIADLYYVLGNSKECDKPHANQIEDNSFWRYGYIGWSDC